MSGFTTLNNEHLIRSDVWSRQLKQLLLDDLQAMKFVRMISDFPDGTTLHIPSLGEAETFDFAEGQAVKYNKFDTGDFTFSFDQYKGSAVAISEKFKRDSFYSQEVIASFLPRQHRALMEAVETRILSRGPSAQTASDPNNINGIKHRWVASGTSNTITVTDFAAARLALTKAQVPMQNLVAIVDPGVAYTLETQANLSNLLSPMPMAEDVYKNGLVTGYQFRYNILGFDVYVSNYLQNGISETISGRTTSAGIANLFFSAVPGDVMPLIGGFRQQPTVQSEFNKDLQQTEYLTICEYGFQLYRPENMLVVLTDAVTP